MTARAVFLDKDGTLVENVPMNVDPSRIRLADGAAEALRRLREAGYRLAVVSNQAGVAHGRFPESALAGVESRLAELLAEHDIRLDGFFYCPHDPAGAVEQYRLACDCRKPAPGLVYRAAAALGVDVASSWMVGDILDDVEAGRRAGCRSILLDSGGETEWVRGPAREPHFVARSFDEVADYILRSEAA
ncbi:MAG TPA: HAD family hydrolase [Gemmatimonadaceae bacterium]|jgi:histidinol-phosphate phosphatase family protein